MRACPCLSGCLPASVWQESSYVSPSLHPVCFFPLNISKRAAGARSIKINEKTETMILLRSEREEREGKKKGEGKRESEKRPRLLPDTRIKCTAQA